MVLRWTSWKAISTAEVNDWALENKVVEKSNLGLRLSVEDDSAICPRGGVRHWNVVEEEAAADYANNSGVDPMALHSALTTIIITGTDTDRSHTQQEVHAFYGILQKQREKPAPTHPPE